MPENVEVTMYIKKDGTIYINQDKVADPERLQSLLEETFLTVTEKKLYLRADGDLEYGTLIDIYEKVRAAGIENIAIITEAKTGEKGS